MNSLDISLLINLLGFAVGAMLYVILLTMVWRRSPLSRVFGVQPEAENQDWQLFATAILGLTWNLGELIAQILHNFNNQSEPAWLTALSYAALGFLPTFVVYYALQPDFAEKPSAITKYFIRLAYLMSFAAGGMQFYAAFFLNIAPSKVALQILSFGTLAFLLTLFVFTFRQSRQRRFIWAIALSVFAFSAFHTTQHAETAYSAFWLLELIGHHSSLPLALAILYQDYRFAFADLFLKRLLVLSVLFALACGLYIFVVEPFLLLKNAEGQISPLAIGILLALWVGTALFFPSLQRGVNWLVDKILLQRTDYAELRLEIAQEISKLESSEQILETICRKLAPALTAQTVNYQEFQRDFEETGINLDWHIAPIVRLEIKTTKVFIPTTESPFYEIQIGEMSGGRRLFSDDLAMLENIAVTTARRIDAVRVTHERCEQEIREQAIGKLASEAQLRALRAQINPHFLFNALTSIGYLINTSPPLALETLLKLTKLLRGVLRSTSEFVTLDEEIKIIETYLEIEKVRFEERLRYKIDIPSELRQARIPAFLWQPLVENAIKHGIAPLKNGGEVIISAKIETDENKGFDKLCLIVSDSGAGVNDIELKTRKNRGVGLNNIEERLQTYCGNAARLQIQSKTGSGTSAIITLPVQISSNGMIETLKSKNNGQERRKIA